MESLFQEPNFLQISKYFGPADVLSYDEEEKTAAIKIKASGEEYNTLGKLAIPNCCILLKGDIVLAAGNDINNLFIIGIVERIKNEETAIENITLSDKPAQIFSSRGELLFKHDPKTRNSSINVESGNLEFISQNGDINFVSGKNINFKSSQSVIVESLKGIRLSIVNIIGKSLSNISFNPKKINMESSELEFTSKLSNIKSEEMNYIGKRFSGTLKQSKIIVGKLETIANDIFCKTKNMFNTIEETSQIRANRMRTFIKDTLHIKAKNSYLKSEKDFKINGDKIHLG